MNTKAKFLLVFLAIIAIGAYIFFYGQPRTSSSAESVPAATSSKPVPDTGATYTPPPTQGAAGVSNPGAPAGSAAECAKCDAYPTAQKAQCLVDLNCQ